MYLHPQQPIFLPFKGLIGAHLPPPFFLIARRTKPVRGLAVYKQWR